MIIAETLRQAMPISHLSDISDIEWGERRQWEHTVERFLELLLAHNSRFNPEQFKKACGYTR